MFVNHWGIEHWMMKDLPTQDWIHQFETIRKQIINALRYDSNASKIDTEICS
jgi:hypothetical protein